MSVFLHVTLEIHAAKQQKFAETLEEILPILEGEGWKLRGAFVQRTGRLHNVIDLWELDDFNHYDRGIQALAKHPRFAALSAALAESVNSETVVFADRASYFRGR